MKVWFGIAFLTLGIAQSSFASVTFVSTRSGLSGSDSLSIGAIGPDGTTEVSGFVANTVDSNTVTFTDAGANGFSVLQEGNEWSGNFAPLDLILWTGNINTGNPDAVPVTMTFGSAVAGVGLQIQPDQFGTTFTASIDAFNAGNVDIGSFTENGSSTSANDNSAIFIGVLSDSANIASITINITSPTGLDFAFNELTFGAALATPEPSSLALCLCAAALFPAIVFKRRRNP